MGVKSQGKALKFKEKRFLEEEGICRYRKGKSRVIVTRLLQVDNCVSFQARHRRTGVH